MRQALFAQFYGTSVKRSCIAEAARSAGVRSVRNNPGYILCREAQCRNQ